MRIAITGATGFVGRCLLSHLEKANDNVIEIGRKAASTNTVFSQIGGITADTDFGKALDGCNAVIHLAARVHVMQDNAADSLSAYQAVNWHGTVNLALQAANAGVQRFIYLSSIKVNGEHTIDVPFTEWDSPSPAGPYAVSKWQAEQSLHEVSAGSGMEIVILRPPLVYGPGVKANFYRLMRLVEGGWPLPLGAINNRRSMVYVDNLASALTTCAKHPAAVGKTYIVHDGEDIATPELVCRLAKAMEKSCRLIPVPSDWLHGLATMIGKRDAINRLTQSLEVDSSRIRHDLGWQPPYTLQQGLDETAKWYLQALRRRDY